MINVGAATKELITFVSTTFVFLCLALIITGCFTGSLAQKLQSEIIQDSIGVKKETLVVAEKSMIDTKLFHRNNIGLRWNEISGYFRKFKDDVIISNKSGYPNSQIKAYTKSGRILWTQSSEKWPTNDITGVFIHESGDESCILVLLHGKSGEYIAFLDEEGKTKKIALLANSAKKYYLQIKTFKWLDNQYIVADGYQDTAIYNFDGTLMASLRTPEVSFEADGLELIINNKRYLAIYVVHKASTDSASLFILSSNWEVLYKEIITGKRSVSLARQKNNNRDDLIIHTQMSVGYNEQTKQLILKDVYWRYTITE